MLSRMPWMMYSLAIGTIMVAISIGKLESKADSCMIVQCERVNDLPRNPVHEGLVRIGYGDETYDKEWVELFDKVAGFVRERTGITGYSYGWCGHIADYKPEETTAAINAVLKSSRTALVIPVLVAHNEMF